MVIKINKILLLGGFLEEFILIFTYSYGYDLTSIFTKKGQSWLSN
jgi:hypothetical protein